MAVVVVDIEGRRGGEWGDGRGEKGKQGAVAAVGRPIPAFE